jgi:hypothetical protein
VSRSVFSDKTVAKLTIIFGSFFTVNGTEALPILLLTSALCAETVVPDPGITELTLILSFRALRRGLLVRPALARRLEILRFVLRDEVYEFLLIVVIMPHGGETVANPLLGFVTGELGVEIDGERHFLFAFSLLSSSYQ